MLLRLRSGICMLRNNGSSFIFCYACMKYVRVCLCIMQAGYIGRYTIYIRIVCAAIIIVVKQLFGLPKFLKLLVLPLIL